MSDTQIVTFNGRTYRVVFDEHNNARRVDVHVKERKGEEHHSSEYWRIINEGQTHYWAVYHARQARGK